MGKRLIPPDKGNVEEVALREALEERYLAYALSTIMNRALPDARDGLKPVHPHSLRYAHAPPRSRHGVQEIRQDRRRRDGLISSAWRSGNLRCAGAAGARFLLALSAD